LKNVNVLVFSTTVIRYFRWGRWTVGDNCNALQKWKRAEYICW